MKVLITGVNYRNKGAELMLHGVNQQVSKWSANNYCYLPFREGTFAQRNQSDVGHLLWLESRKLPWATNVFSVVSGAIPKPLRVSKSFALESEIDVILDASGFCFSDQWGVEATRKKLKQFTRWKQQGKKIILLPQAFGSFTSEAIQAAFNQVMDCVDLLFARDRISYEYINQVAKSTDKLRVAPDFTNLVQGEKPSYLDSLAGRPCIIPNYRMIDKTADGLDKTYLNFVVDSIKYLSKNEFNPFILIHETGDDRLVETIQSNLEQEVAVIKEDNSLVLKGILGNCSFVVASRFHGLISALSQGTPCLGIGWSHKYEMLFEDYNCSDLLISLSDNYKSNLGKVSLISDLKTREKLIEKIKLASSKQKELSKKMWAEVSHEIYQ